MDPETVNALTLMVSQGPSRYRDTARALLEGSLTWEPDAIAALIDSFVNEPYLTRFN